RWPRPGCERGCAPRRRGGGGLGSRSSCRAARLPGRSAQMRHVNRNRLFVYYPERSFRLRRREQALAATTPHLSLGAFYAADKRRDISREHDIGLWWLGDDWHAPRYRAAWVDQTGELYVMQHEGMPGGGRVDVVATASSLEEIERRLDGWREVV